MNTRISSKDSVSPSLEGGKRWAFILKVLITVLTALAGALGIASCTKEETPTNSSTPHFAWKRSSLAEGKSNAPAPLGHPRLRRAEHCTPLSQHGLPLRQPSEGFVRYKQRGSWEDSIIAVSTMPCLYENALISREV